MGHCLLLVTDNQPTLKQDIAGLREEAMPPHAVQVGQHRNWVEVRRIRAG